MVQNGGTNLIQFIVDGAQNVADGVQNVADNVQNIVGNVQDIATTTVDNATQQVNNLVSDVVNKVQGNTEYEDDFKGTMAKIKPIATVGAGIVGAIGLSKLGGKFGTVGKIAGGVLGVFLAPKIVDVIKEVGTDISAARDYTERGKDVGVERSWITAAANNILDFGGSPYNGTVVDDLSFD